MDNPVTEATSLMPAMFKACSNRSSGVKLTDIFFTCSHNNVIVS